jgi:tRNA uridine 5-carboxymethylaminomethyl modification enzyme
MLQEYDVLVVGGGHAGNEAAAAAANMGSNVLLVTMNMNTLGQMSCNPAMGGIAKGQIVREIDALGGYSGLVSDRSTIQFRMLNRSKGPAMWSPRSQNDRMAFHLEWRKMLETTPNLDFWQDYVIGILVSHERVVGVKTSLGLNIYATTVVLTNGTFLNGVIHMGEDKLKGGRIGENASYGITEQLKTLGFETGRMKTGTPPRVDGRSLDYSKMEEQKGDENPGCFSFLEKPSILHQLSCHITYTNPIVHDILKTGFEKSPLFAGRIEGIGPRYCPSIEDKIERFSERDRHQIFVEPEGRHTVEVYVNGFSSSLPKEVQLDALRKIEGFDNAKMFRPGYAIEYDYFPPTQLHHTMETKAIKNLFFAGQINGTTGYEEAAAQGLMAGINAHLSIQEKEPFTLSRDQAYIGVLIDDLVTKGTDEPYRMFTSRAEYRLILRQDNADERVTSLGYSLGLASEERYRIMESKYESIQGLMLALEKSSISPQTINPYLEKVHTAPLKQKVKMETLVSRPQVHLSDLLQEAQLEIDIDSSIFENTDWIESAEIQLKYRGYIQREKELAEKFKRLESIMLPKDFDYSILSSLSTEATQKLNHVQPQSLGQASRISGVSPADISVLLVHLGR